MNFIGSSQMPLLVNRKKEEQSERYIFYKNIDKLRGL
jgi:hypothetical protein